MFGFFLDIVNKISINKDNFDSLPKESTIYWRRPSKLSFTLNRRFHSIRHHSCWLLWRPCAGFYDYLSTVYLYRILVVIPSQRHGKLNFNVFFSFVLYIYIFHTTYDWCSYDDFLNVFLVLFTSYWHLIFWVVLFVKRGLTICLN